MKHEEKRFIFICVVAIVVWAVMAIKLIQARGGF